MLAAGGKPIVCKWRNGYLDFLSGFGSVSVGHNHPRVLEAIRECMNSAPVHFSHTAPSPWEAELARRLADLAGPPLERCMFSCSGAEAVEGGLKLACAVTRREHFVYYRGSFHGTTLGTLGVMGHKRMRAPSSRCSRRGPRSRSATWAPWLLH